MRGLTPALRVLALLALVMPLVGARCGGSVNTATVWIDPPISSVPVGTIFTVDVVADVTKGSLQAFELGVTAEASTLAVFSVFPHGDFDDDGKLFLPVSIDFGAGTANRIVDLRHGAPLPMGQVRIATLQVIAHAAGSGSIEITTADLATEDGSPVSVSVLSASIDVTTP
jgi:hypothetical protein